MPPSTTGVIVIAHGQWFAEIAGLPLLHRVLLSGGKAGVRRWIVLVQHEAQWVRSSLATAYKLRDIAWQVHDLTEPERLAAAFPAEDVLAVERLLPVRALVAERGVEVAPAVVVRAPRDRVVVGGR